MTSIKLNTPFAQFNRSDSAELMASPITRKTVKTQRFVDSRAEGGKNDSAYETPKAGTLSFLQLKTVDFLEGKLTREITALTARREQAAHMAVATGHGHAHVTTQRDQLNRTIDRLTTHRDALIALRAGNPMPAMVDELGLALETTLLTHGDSQARARHDSVVGAIRAYDNAATKGGK